MVYKSGKVGVKIIIEYNIQSLQCECVWWGMYYYTNDGRWEMRAEGGRVGLVARG